MKTVMFLSLLGLVPMCFLSAASDTQTVTLKKKLEVPGATLKSGQYVFQVEDRLQDRAIIRVTNTNTNAHELLLAVPNEKLNGSARELVFFPGEHAGKQVLQAWMCGSCDAALELVYPKAEALKITESSAKPVMAVDPVYDKLPKNLTADDMKVVTLWLLAPKEVTPEGKGKGVEAAKLADMKAKTTEMASARPAPERPAPAAPAASPAPAVPATPVAPSVPAAPSDPAAPVAMSGAPISPATAPAVPVTSADTTAQVAPPDASQDAVPIASARTHGRRMPHTAGSTFDFALAGIGLLGLGSGLWLQRRWQAAASNS